MDVRSQSRGLRAILRGEGGVLVISDTNDKGKIPNTKHDGNNIKQKAMKHRFICPGEMDLEGEETLSRGSNCNTQTLKCLGV